ncbi:MAG: hypothetical protein ACFHWX_06880 [Bacteroidota bacterium]
MKQLSLMISLLWVLTLTAQEEQVIKYVKEGIGYHDTGNYEDAIIAYRHALYVDPGSPLANYEIAMTFSTINEHDSALKYVDKVLAFKNDHHLMAYITKGNTLDALGRGDEAIDTYKKALANEGPHYLLLYNMAVTYNSHGETDKAIENLINGISQNAGHPSSHLLLANIMKSQSKTVQSLLGYYYFLLIEPGTSRSEGAFTSLMQQFGGNVEENKDGGFNILINTSAIDKKNEFSSAELMVSMLSVTSSLPENKDKSEEELFVSNTESFFKILGELKKKKDKGLWWELYIPFFYDLARSDHLEAYCYYISQSSNTAAMDWLNANPDKLRALDQWLRGG